MSFLFTAAPRSMFVDLVRIDWYWGCPAPIYVVEHSIDGDSRGFDWDNLMFNILFWVLYFTLLGLGGRAILRKIGLNIRPGFCLIALWIATVLLYAHLYRPDRLINLVTGGYLGFLESRSEQVDLAMRFRDVETLQALFRKYPELASSVDPMWVALPRAACSVAVPLPKTRTLPWAIIGRPYRAFSLRLPTSLRGYDGQVADR